MGFRGIWLAPGAAVIMGSRRAHGGHGAYFVSANTSAAMLCASSDAGMPL